MFSVSVLFESKHPILPSDLGQLVGYSLNLASRNFIFRCDNVPLEHLPELTNGSVFVYDSFGGAMVSFGGAAWQTMDGKKEIPELVGSLATAESFKNLITLTEGEQKGETEWMKTDKYHLFKYGSVAPEGGHCYLSSERQG